MFNYPKQYANRFLELKKKKTFMPKEKFKKGIRCGTTRIKCLKH